MVVRQVDFAELFDYNRRTACDSHFHPLHRKSPLLHFWLHSHTYLHKIIVTADYIALESPKKSLAITFIHPPYSFYSYLLNTPAACIDFNTTNLHSQVKWFFPGIHLILIEFIGIFILYFFARFICSLHKRPTQCVRVFSRDGEWTLNT